MAEPVEERFLPDPALSTAEMEARQREIGAAATFADDHDLDAAALAVEAPVDPDPVDAPAEGPVVVGVDQAFRDDVGVSAAVALRGDAVVRRGSAATPLEIPYVPGLLAYREGQPVLAGLRSLSVEPDLLVLDGSGRIHFRQAGLATHVGVLLDVPAVGVAKNLLCGDPRRSVEGLAAGDRVAVEAGEDCEATDGTVIGYAFQSRQFDSPGRHVNPLYVSPGHRVSAETAVDLVEALCAGYKLPEPTRLADEFADRAKAVHDGG